jgi:hypothetical protein
MGTVVTARPGEPHMPIVSNLIPEIMRAEITAAVCSEMRELLEHGLVWLDQLENSSDFLIRFQGRDGRGFELRFCGLQQTPDNVREAVKTAVKAAQE